MSEPADLYIHLLVTYIRMNDEVLIKIQTSFR